MGNDMFLPMNYVGRIEKMYPDIHKKITPYVENMAESLSENQRYRMTQEDLNHYTNEIIKKGKFHENLPQGHNYNTVSDIVTAMFVRELLDCHRRRPEFYDRQNHLDEYIHHPPDNLHS
ncbi:MAG: hypothetical protein LBR68_07210 [Lachnoclostridium sp.]|jgi:hypothetical protein|nr:hypothetical protein [Lachnoclostridium sp.]